MNASEFLQEHPIEVSSNVTIKIQGQVLTLTNTEVRQLYSKLGTILSLDSVPNNAYSTYIWRDGKA